MSLFQSFRREPSLRRPAVALAVLVAVVLLGERVLTAAFDGVSQGSAGFPPWLPQLGTIGETVVFYTLAMDALTYVAIPATVAWLAYAYGRRRGDAEACYTERRT